jgi:hypothetical protein
MADCTLSLVDLNKAASFILTGINQGISPETLLATYPKSCHEAIWKLVQDESVPISQLEPDVLGQRNRREWAEGYSSAEGYLWNNLHNYLSQILGRKPSEINALDLSSDEVLFRLGRPDETGPELEKVKGLVIGYVQSGKTANYTALAAKAFDAGFKIVIVLAGIHNELRRQTQIRLNTELGISQSTPERKTARNAPFPPGLGINVMTHEGLKNGDFHYGTFPKSILENGRFLFVSKKNSSVLERLNRWLGDKVDLPTLIIDDEADQASINTKGNREIFDVLESEPWPGAEEEISPAVINGKIRTLLGKFSNVSYVGYTATPYANVFIQHDAVDRVVGGDLYPKDFILSLPKPRGYTGPEEFFGSEFLAEDGRESIANQVLEIVPPEDCEEISNLDSAVLPSAAQLPRSLKHALQCYILLSAAKRVKDLADSPCSMLIHASHIASKQKFLAEVVENYLAEMWQNWRYNNDESKADWIENWRIISKGSLGTSLQFSELEPFITDLLAMQVMLLNHLSEDELDYETNPNLKAVIVGGNKLSRGLTLEGLLVSYFVRMSSAPKADTLTQMGRFFGYRNHLIDFTRIFTTEQLRSDFREIAEMESHLRREVHRYALSGKTPLDFAPRVQKRFLLWRFSANDLVPQCA